MKARGFYRTLPITTIFVVVACSEDINSPTVETNTIEFVASNMATVGCKVNSDGGSDIIECGVYFGTSQSPETTGTKFQMGYDTGLFLGQVSGLLPNTQYFVKAYADNLGGESRGEQVNFTTPATITDYDNNVYETVKIGSQIWMAKNLKTTHYLNGDAISTTIPATLDISGQTSPKYQWSYGGDDNNTSVYGKLYTWYALMDARKVCPSGWHIPTDNEWATLETTLGGNQIAANKLKEIGNTHWLSPYIFNSDATNESCFSALPGGYRDWNGTFWLIHNDGYWWSANESEALESWARIIDVGSPVVGRFEYLKGDGASVRCVKDY